MLSLHWILALTLVFVHCLIAIPINNTQRLIWNDIKVLENHTCTKKGLTYSFSDLPHRDARVALYCQIQRLDAICEECFSSQKDPFKSCKRIGDKITKNMQYKLPHTQAAIICENKTKTFDEFLVELKTLLYKVHSS